MMREPAKSCVVCRRALGPSDVLYNQDAETVCEVCLALTGGEAGTPPRPGFVAAMPTRFERQRRFRTWSVVWVGFALASLYAAHAARAHRRPEHAVGVIDSPDPGTQVQETVTVRGWVKETGQRSLWLLGRWDDNDHCVGSIRRVVPNVVDGTFVTELTLRGYLRQQIALVMADDEAAKRLAENERRLARVNATLGRYDDCNLSCERLTGLEGMKGVAGAGLVSLASATVQLEDHCTVY